jgi:hypothetical protein
LHGHDNAEQRRSGATRSCDSLTAAGTPDTKAAAMRFRFGRRASDEDADTRKRGGKNARARDRAARRGRDRRADPIRNWESPEQQFLREAGDPSLDG